MGKLKNMFPKGSFPMTDDLKDKLKIHLDKKVYREYFNTKGELFELREEFFLIHPEFQAFDYELCVTWHVRPAWCDMWCCDGVSVGDAQDTLNMFNGYKVEDFQ